MANYIDVFYLLKLALARGAHLIRSRIRKWPMCIQHLLVSRTLARCFPCTVSIHLPSKLVMQVLSLCMCVQIKTETSEKVKKPLVLQGLWQAHSAGHTPLGPSITPHGRGKDNPPKNSPSGLLSGQLPAIEKLVISTEFQLPGKKQREKKELFRSILRSLNHLKSKCDEVNY